MKNIKNTLHKIFLASVLVVLIFAVVVKIHHIVTFPKIEDWNYHQIERINKNKNNFSFIVFGDNKNSITTFQNLIKDINKEDALFAIDDGDLVYDGEMEKFRFFIKQIQTINKPFLTVIGNHEIKEGGRANYYDLFGRFYYSFAIGKSYFIVLDDANERNLDPWQLEWLKKELKRSQKYKYRFVFMHVPLFDPRPGLNHSLLDKNFARYLNNLFDQYKVTMIFASHIHAYFRGFWQNTPYIITGGAGAELAGTDPKHYFYHYIKVKVMDNGINYQVVKLESPPLELIDRLIHDAWIFIYAFFAIHFWDIIILGLFLILSFDFLFFKKDLRKESKD